MMSEVNRTSTDFNNEQNEMLRILDGRKKIGKRFTGDVACRIVQEFLQRHVPDKVKVITGPVYIENYSTEFDLMVVDSTAKPIQHTNAYPSDRVRFVIEVKASGMVSDKEGKDKYERIKNAIKKQRETFENVEKEFPNIKCCYLSYQERIPKKTDSISYLDMVQKILAPYGVFTLRESRTEVPLLGEWRHFVEHINKF